MSNFSSLSQRSFQPPPFLPKPKKTIPTISRNKSRVRETSEKTPSLIIPQSPEVYKKNPPERGESLNSEYILPSSETASPSDDSSSDVATPEINMEDTV